MKKIYLKPGKEIPVKFRHHWIFSGAVKNAHDKISDGDIVAVYSDRNELLGHGYFNNTTTIQIRMLNFSGQDPLESIKENISNAVALRNKVFGDDTNTYRVINGEGDLIPGLVVDRYNTVLVIQIATVGIEALKPMLVETLIEATKDWGIESIYEKSNMPARGKDGLQNFAGFVWGKEISSTVVLENNIKFEVDFIKGQKTGLFLDMREMRKLVGEYTKGRTVLNCFSYSGGFSLYAAVGGAKSVTSVDSDDGAIALSKRNFEINDLKVPHLPIAVDAFKFLNDDPLQYDFIILDPPAFAKKKDDIPQAKRGYGQINRLVLSKIPKGSFLLTCSCSYHLDKEEFEQVVKKAASDARRSAKIISKHHLASDHPININHTEVDYLKSILLYVE
jgi:23S rRNA (cytosine1962-C5)-methyltransferase